MTSCIYHTKFLRYIITVVDNNAYCKSVHGNTIATKDVVEICEVIQTLVKMVTEVRNKTQKLLYQNTVKTQL